MVCVIDPSGVQCLKLCLFQEEQFYRCGRVLDAISLGAVKVCIVTDEDVRYNLGQIFICPINVVTIRF